MKCLLLFAILLRWTLAKVLADFKANWIWAEPSGINLAGPIDHVANFSRQLDGRSTKGNGNSS